MAFKLLDGATTTGPSEVITTRKVNKDHAFQVNITGAPTAVTVHFEGSLDGVFWPDVTILAMSASELTAGTSYTSTTGEPLRFVRVNLVTLTGGTSPTVTVLYEPQEHRS